MLEKALLLLLLPKAFSSKAACRYCASAAAGCDGKHGTDAGSESSFDSCLLTTENSLELFALLLAAWVGLKALLLDCCSLHINHCAIA